VRGTLGALDESERIEAWKEVAVADLPAVAEHLDDLKTQGAEDIAATGEPGKVPRCGAQGGAPGVTSPALKQRNAITKVITLQTTMPITSPGRSRASRPPSRSDAARR